jgi:hypothetical protein
VLVFVEHPRESPGTTGGAGPGGGAIPAAGVSIVTSATRYKRERCICVEAQICRVRVGREEASEAKR